MRLVSARIAAPYLVALLLSCLIDLLLRARLLFDLDFYEVSHHQFSDHLLRFLVGGYFCILSVFLVFFLVKILPSILRNGSLNRRDVSLFGFLATMQLASNLIVINLAIYLVSIASYELLFESIALYFSINLIFLFWYWFLDYPLRHQRLMLVGTDGNNAIGIPLGILFPEEAMERDLSGSDVWTPGLVDYVFFTLVSSNTFGSPEGHGVIGSRLKWTQVFHSICMILVFIVIVARAINTLV
jgi:hypothetical protein